MWWNKKNSYVTNFFSPADLLSLKNLKKTSACCNPPRMHRTAKAENSCTKLSSLPGHRSGCPAEPEPVAVLFWHINLWLLSPGVFTCIEVGHEVTKTVFSSMRVAVSFLFFFFFFSYKKDKNKAKGLNGFSSSGYSLWSHCYVST